MKLCVFHGTFDPIHNAHMDMAHFALKKYGFDTILFVPAYNPPHKECDLKMANHRMQMVWKAVGDIFDFDISDLEYRRDGKSYTYPTICELYNNYDVDGKINFIIGADAFEKIDTWFEAEKLKKIVRFIVFKRSNYIVNPPSDCDFELAEMDFEDISSTKIREYVKKGKDISNLVPKKVKEYIEQNGLYKS